MQTKPILMLVNAGFLLVADRLYRLKCHKPTKIKTLMPDVGYNKINLPEVIILNALFSFTYTK